jgi:hypothetical protein
LYFCFSETKVAADISGPTAVAVPNACGAPGGNSPVFCGLLRHPPAAPSNAREVPVKNCLRDFNIAPSFESHLWPSRETEMYSIQTSIEMLEQS